MLSNDTTRSERASYARTATATACRHAANAVAVRRKQHAYVRQRQPAIRAAGRATRSADAALIEAEGCSAQFGDSQQETAPQVQSSAQR